MSARKPFAVVAAACLLLAQAQPVHAQVYELINSFAGCPAEGCGPAGDAAQPVEPLVLGPDGRFYGTSPIEWRSGEAAPRGWGTIFRVNSDGTRTVLHHFPGTGPGGCGSSSVTFGGDGRLYGVGDRCGLTGSEVIYRLDGTAIEVLQEFPASLGFRPFTLVASANGAFYGAGEEGSLPVIYKWNGATATTLRTATDVGINGSFGRTLIAAPDGNLYFTESAYISLPFDFLTAGSVMRLTPDDRFEVVHAFSDNSKIAPDHDMILGQDGSLYGTEVRVNESSGFVHRLYRLTLDGTFTYLSDSAVGRPLGVGSDGSVYLGAGTSGAGITRLTPDGAIVPVHDFNGADGDGWVSVLARGLDGNLYGVTQAGGEHGLGVFFRIRMPRVDIKANGVDGPIDVNGGQALQIAMGFDAASDAVNPSEVYLAIVTPALQVIWTTPSGFSLSPTPLYSGPLPSFPSTPLFTVPDAAVLPPGDYYWVAIVDADSNGVPNGHYVDFVKTTKTDAALTTVRRR